MQEFSVAFGRVSRATFSADPELKSHITNLVDRAYFNLHNIALTSADSQWAKTIIAACMQLCLDHRVRTLPPRALIQLFENVIRVSEEHLREAKRHAAMASNVFYLKETALDAAFIEQEAPANLNHAASTVIGLRVAHSGRLRTKQDSDA
jgi:hypothetical protein